MKLMGVTSHVLRAVKRFKNLKSGGLSIPTTLTPEERSVAEGLWITHAVRNCAVEFIPWVIAACRARPIYRFVCSLSYYY